MVELWLGINTALLFVCVVLVCLGVDGRFEKHIYILLLSVVTITFASWMGFSYVA